MKCKHQINPRVRNNMKPLNSINHLWPPFFSSYSLAKLFFLSPLCFSTNLEMYPVALIKAPTQEGVSVRGEREGRVGRVGGGAWALEKLLLLRDPRA